MWEVVKLALIVSRGNASVESGFSVNKCILIENEKEDIVLLLKALYICLLYTSRCV